MEHSFISKLELFSFSIDIVETDVFNEVLKKVSAFINDTLYFFRYGLLVEAKIGGERSLMTVSTSSGNWGFPINSKSEFYSFEAASFTREMPLWLVSEDDDTLINARRIVDLWSHENLKDITQCHADKETMTAAMVPFKSFKDFLGIMVFESTRRINLSDDLKTSLTKISESVGRLYSSNRTYLINRRSIVRSLELLTTSPTSTSNSKIEKQQFSYAVALSFAGEDRPLVRKIAEGLKKRDVKVFFDEYEKALLWGKDLLSELDTVYRKEAKFCIPFLSKYYARKPWPKRERESALARAFSDRQDYILPVRIDDTDIPGIPPTTAYVDAREIPTDEIVRLILKKLNHF